MWVSVFVAIIEYFYIYGKDNKGGKIIKIRDCIDYDLVFTWWFLVLYCRTYRRCCWHPILSIFYFCY